MTPTTERARVQATAESPRVRRVKVLGPNLGRVLAVYFENGECRMLNVSRFILPDTVFAPLDAYDTFADISVLPYGRGVEWAVGADLSRDTLYLESEYVGTVVREEPVD